MDSCWYTKVSYLGYVHHAITRVFLKLHLGCNNGDSSFYLVGGCGMTVVAVAGGDGGCGV